MQDNLVIVESPAKAKTIEKFLGKGYVVKSSFGHIRDLAKKGLGIDIANDFAPHYEISADKKKTVAELEKLAKEAKTVWLASDEDREGRPSRGTYIRCSDSRTTIRSGSFFTKLRRTRFCMRSKIRAGST